MFELRKTLELARVALNESNVDFALIGGFALSFHGIHRATSDIDFIADGSKRELIKKSLLNAGFQIRFESKEVLQFQGPGFLDVLLANRPLSIEMLKQSNSDNQLQIPVISAEGLIGLKIQAYMNDAERKHQDLADIQLLLKLPDLNMNQVKQYADLFDEWTTIEELSR